MINATDILILLTFLYVNKLEAMISGNRNKQINHPHANNLSSISCHKATNVNTGHMLYMKYLDPPNGIKMYLLHTHTISGSFCCISFLSVPHSPSVECAMPTLPEPLC